MSGWRKRQIADGVEKEMTCPESRSITEWFVDNNAEITWFLIGFLLCDMIEQLIRQHYWHAGWNFFIITVNYLLRKQGFRK